MSQVLPIDEHEKAKLLPIRSPRLRLRLVVHWIEQLNNTWSVYVFPTPSLRVVLMYRNPGGFLTAVSSAEFL